MRRTSTAMSASPGSSPGSRGSPPPANRQLAKRLTSTVMSDARSLAEFDGDGDQKVRKPIFAS